MARFRTCENENKNNCVIQAMCARTCRTGRVGSYWTKSAFRLNKYRLCRRQNMAHWLLFLSLVRLRKQTKATSEVSRPRSSAFSVNTLVPKTGATLSFVGLDLSFVASYGDAVLLGYPEELLPLRHLPGDSLSNLTVAPLAARAYRLSRRHFLELSDDQRPSKAFLIAWSRSFRPQRTIFGQDFLCT